MGVDIQALRFLLRSRPTVSFDRFLMLGRQWCHVPRKDLLRELKRSRPALAEIETAVNLAIQSHFIEPVIELLGTGKAESLDYSDYEQATYVHDINQPPPKELRNRFSCVYDGGTLEHVFDFPRAIRNAMEMVAVGGHFLGIGPTNNFPGHGFYQFSPELYWRIFSKENGFEVEEVSVAEHVADGAAYLIDDPAKVGGRIEFTNSRPAYVMVRARRLHEAEIFKTLPQQPYYATAWSPQTASGGERQGRESLRNWAKRSLPEPVKNILRPFAPKVRPLRFSGFKKI